jgi:two-component system CheB/CheR fusion protein
MACENDRDAGSAADGGGLPDGIAAPIDFSSRARLPFTVVGIGASAGGVEALRSFFAASPAASGMAYVVIQHLAPDHESLMAEILGRCTAMPVAQIEDGMAVQPDHVYVIRPGHTLTLADGRLHFGAPVDRRGHRHPVDDFFRSLAREQKENAIAIVLSGTGSNGSAGAQAIKAAGGLCIAQDPDTADFPGMPQNLIYSGYADQVLNIEEMPEALQRYARQPPLGADTAAHAVAAHEIEHHRAHLHDIINLLRSRTGHDFSSYKTPTVLRRIQRRMGLMGASSLARYSAQLPDKPGEISSLANDLMINVTGFFRDPEAWEALREAVVRPLIEQRPSREPIRAWVTACASGEEPYSLAMLIAEETERAGKPMEVKIFATDTADRALALARAGVFPSGIEGDLSPARLDRFFDAEEHSYRIKQTLRNQVVFAPQDLLRDPPFSRVDIVTCRNLLIYLEPEAQRRALGLLHFALREGGYLLLGTAETLGQAESMFEVVSKRWRIYRRLGPGQPRFAPLATSPARGPDGLRPAAGDAAEATPARAAMRAEARTPRRDDDQVLDEELRRMRRELQSSVEAFETSNEELKAANEEVTSINEELQSSNEELEAGKEELQSLNEELNTVNGQLQAKILELEALTNDLDNLLSSTDIAVVFLDTQLCVRRFTPAVRDLLELIPADIGRPLAHLAQKFTDPSLLRDAGEVLQQRAPLQAEVLSHSGRYYLRRALPYRRDGHRFAGVVLTFIDMTALKRGEQAIAAAQIRLQAVIEQMPAAVLMAEAPSGNLLLGNRRAATLFNHAFPLPFIGEYWTAAFAGCQAFHADGRAYQPPHWPLARALTSAAVVLDEEFDRLCADGSRCTLSMSAAPIRNADGEVVAAVAAFWDISERRRAQAALRDSEERFRMLVEGAHDYAIFMLDPQGRVVSWNPGAERVTGYSEQQILGQPGAILFTPEDRSAGVPEQEQRLALESGHALDERWHLHRDGTRFWASGTITVARDAREEPQGFVKILRDQTARKEIDARLQEALRSAQHLRSRAEDANRAKDEFIASVSHELRTPLNTIRLWASMLLSGKVHEKKDIISGGNMIDRAAQAQQQLIDDLLDVSRMTSGQLRLVKRDTRLREAIESAIDAVRPLAENHRVAIGTELESGVGSVYVDADRIQQVVWNLLSNAVKFTPAGGQVEVRLRRSGERIEIEVSDNGIGISPDFLPQVFDRFHQADATAARRYAGLGLGLAIAKQLVELHGGSISAYSAGQGKGACFTVRLPLEPSNALPPAGEPPDSEHGADFLRGTHVLLVEDEDMSREATERLLAHYGAQVTATNCAAQALAAFLVQRPDVIVADIGMPDEDGYAFLTKLRRIEHVQSSRRVPAVATTAFARAIDRQRALAVGFDEHLPKPVNPERLISAIAHLVRAHDIASDSSPGG